MAMLRSPCMHNPQSSRRASSEAAFASSTRFEQHICMPHGQSVLAAKAGKGATWPALQSFNIQATPTTPACRCAFSLYSAPPRHQAGLTGILQPYLHSCLEAAPV
jgi:hypothetical protein